MGEPSDPAAGEVLADRYEVLRVIGRGAMGVVVAAHDRWNKAHVALKLMYAQDARNAMAVERFFREARAATRLSGDHVLKVFDAQRLPDGRPFLVTELLEGKDVAAVLVERGPLPIDVAARFARDAALACSSAHGGGVVHRDIKPSNLFACKGKKGDEHVKLLDFGISKLSGLSGTQQHNITASGDVTGTPLYMPPEQLRARDVDGRADIWAIGATLYEMLTGKRPFAAATMMVECNRILTEEPALPSSLRREVPRGLDAVVMRCLQKTAEARFATADELAVALSAFTAKKRRASMVIGLASLGLLALVGAGVLVVHEKPQWLPPSIANASWLRHVR